MINLSFTYLLESSLCLLLFTVTYKLLIKNLTHFSWTRFYLLASVILSLILPVIVLPIQWKSNLALTEVFNNLYLLQANQPEIKVTGAAQTNLVQIHSGINAQTVILYSLTVIYLVGLMYRTFGFVKNLNTIQQFIIRNPKEKENNYWIIRLNNEMPAFSFFNFIFINHSYNNLSAADLQLIKNHELVHVKQYHTIDILFFEIVSIVFWFNPLMKYLRKSLQEVHEYIVDQEIAGKGEQKKAYAQLLLSLASETKTFSLTVGFTGEYIKRRISMIARPKTLPIYRSLFFILVPLSVIMLLSFSFIQTPGSPEKNNQPSNKVTSENRIGEITWIGNAIFSADTLNKLLGYKKGDYFSFDELSERLLKGEVSTLYFDNGNVFYKADFSVNLKPNLEYDIAITIYEGVQAYMGIISIKGNTTVPSFEILEKVLIRPGDLFNKTKIINSVKAIAAMGKFVPEEIEPVPVPNEETRRIDLVFNVKEK